VDIAFISFPLAIDRAHPPRVGESVCSDLGLSAVDEEFGSVDEACVLRKSRKTTAPATSIGGNHRPDPEPGSVEAM